MYHQKSDCLVVVMKLVKASGAKGTADRRFLEGKAAQHGRLSMPTEFKKIKYQAIHYPTVQGIMHYVNEQTLMAVHQRQDIRKAKGIDGVNKLEYDENAAENIHNLVERMRKFRYKPQPVRRTYIPKPNGKQRPLGIPSYEDRVVQGVMADLLSTVYEERFLDCSYGFRPKRGAHDVVRYINRTIMGKRVNFILDADIRGFFDNVDHAWLMKFLAHDIQDRNFLYYVERFLKAGVMEGNQFRDSDRGTPQGGLISPVLANVYLHYVLDLWVERRMRKKVKGEMHYVRYADDFLIMFQREEDAAAVLEELCHRLEQFGLELSENKTRILPFGRYRKTEKMFDFLGFTFYNTLSRNGKYRVGIRTCAKKLRAKVQAAKLWLRSRLAKPVNETMKTLSRALLGHNAYYGINGNLKSVQTFYYIIGRMTHKMLNRRSQKAKVTWEKFARIWKFHIKEPRVLVNIWY